MTVQLVVTISLIVGPVYHLYWLQVFSFVSTDNFRQYGFYW